jgi:mono/diheme cytochrome c family protein
VQKLIVFLLIAGIFTFLFQGCSYEKEDLLNPNYCDTSNVTYQKTVAPIITVNCLPCHGNDVYTSLGAHINLDGYANLIGKANNGVLLKSIQHATGLFPMPKNQSKLSECNIEKIEKWINNGAANN